MGKSDHFDARLARRALPKIAGFDLDTQRAGSGGRRSRELPPSAFVTIAVNRAARCTGQGLGARDCPETFSWVVDRQAGLGG
jgi:hypothetical protein